MALELPQRYAMLWFHVPTPHECANSLYVDGYAAGVVEAKKSNFCPRN